jgi:hypothetical protein
MRGVSSTAHSFGRQSTASVMGTLYYGHTWRSRSQTVTPPACRGRAVLLVYICDTLSSRISSGSRVGNGGRVNSCSFRSAQARFFSNVLTPSSSRRSGNPDPLAGHLTLGRWGSDLTGGWVRQPGFRDSQRPHRYTRPDRRADMSNMQMIHCSTRVDHEMARESRSTRLPDGQTHHSPRSLSRLSTIRSMIPSNRL